ncbi:uncharacterized protein F5Z01DRAFT_635458 [Emericellopsis atlantica]|uniref:Amine oxidase domain-containing protein n=1 Tax=Emericellopsis atlantica TaxID=2614577 RepID=A0A9P8CR14_9HYPO|nr:uncharacterized protein F5Z01DRAFT_635458 [Emericellopsis atlantica]KAG9255837.1 hypothetical protein F5Z01DRAFT_635458 [Emericellopsis atlantica]
MDAYSISYSSSSKGKSSRIYQDLSSTHFSSFRGLGQEQSLRELSTMDTCRMRSHSGSKKPHVGIVGAGLAGLRCADIVLRHGFQVTILEGRNRIGGRLHQEKLSNGHLVDMGPNWIHGTKDNPILDIVNETKTDVGSWDTRSYAFDEFGGLFDVAKSDMYADIMWDIVQDAFKHSNDFSAEINEKESLHDFFTEKMAEKIPETDQDWQMKRHIVMQMSELWGAFVGSPIERQSLKFFWLEECIEGVLTKAENLFCAGTYKKVLESVAAPALAEASIQFNIVVDQITTRIQPGDTIKVHEKNGSSLEFDEVIVTAPLGWLKRNLDIFEPSLPARLTQAINSIGYGSLEKVYITFPEAFWLSQADDDQKVQGFIQWLSPAYAPDTNPERWYQDVVELASLTPETSHPTLLFYIYGAQSEHVTTRVAELQTKQEKDEFLLAYFRPYYSRLPHYKESDERCQPTSYLSTAWSKDALAGHGSYSNFQVGLTEGDRDIEAMRRGLPERGLWLAGEHTAPFVALGTATGAYWSGEAVARRLAESYGMKTAEVSQ